VAEKVGARLVREERVERLAVLGEVDSVRERVPHPSWSASRTNFS
jgi:hypothetical protein